MVSDGAATTAELATGTGRLSFICGVLEYERPFLSPCFAHLANLRTNDPSGRGVNSVKPLPLYVACAMEFIAARTAAQELSIDHGSFAYGVVSSGGRTGRRQRGHGRRMVATKEHGLSHRQIVLTLVFLDARRSYSALGVLQGRRTLPHHRCARSNGNSSERDCICSVAASKRSIARYHYQHSLQSK